MDRIKFDKGKQREFLDLVIIRINSPSLRGLLQFGLETTYENLKNYYSERRLLPRDLFEDMIYLAKLKKKDFRFSYLDENWGRVKGGKIKKLKR
jgi:hypothetical protein